MQSIRFDSLGLNSLGLNSPGLDNTGLVGTESPRRMAEACAPHLSSLDIGLGFHAISALEFVGNFSALGDLNAAMRIQAVARLPSQNAPRLGRGRETLLTAPAGWLDDNLNGESGRRVLEQLSGFVRSEEIPSDAREKMSVFIT